MALQTISQILSPTNAPYINGTAARLRFSAAVLRNLYQGLIEKDGKGIDDNFVSSSDAEDSAQIFVHRVLPTEINPREIGSSKNGASYSQNQHYTQTVTVGIEILQLIDDPILIPRVTQDHIAIDLLKEQVQIFSDRLATILNGATAASKILSGYAYKAEGHAIRETTIDATVIANKQILKQFIVANGYLDEGDETNGIDIFPRKTRVAVVKTSFGPILKADGVLQLGGANEVYAILKAAGVNNEGERIEEDGFLGTIDGVEVRAISNESLKHASLFLGFPKYELKNSNFLGYIASSYANARGVSTSKQTKVVDEVNGQGIRLLPYVKFGVVSWYPLGNSFLVSGAFDPITNLKAVYDAVKSTLSVTGDITFKLKGAASRLFPVYGAFTVTDSTHIALSATALDDWGNDHLKVGAYIVTDSTAGAFKTVNEFLNAWGSASAKGAVDLVNGTTTLSAAVSNTNWINVLAIADDGSVNLISKQVSGLA